MSVKSTVICDSCEQQYMLDDGMDMPPLWLGIQVIIADTEGIIPMHERDVFLHFCSSECLAAYVNSDTLQERIAMIEYEYNNEEDPGDDQLEEENDVPD